jgi:hypothetical protein
VQETPAGCDAGLGEQRAVDGLNHLALPLHVAIRSNHLEIEDPGAVARLVGRFEQAAATLGLWCVLADCLGGYKAEHTSGDAFFD